MTLLKELVSKKADSRVHSRANSITVLEMLAILPEDVEYALRRAHGKHGTYYFDVLDAKEKHPRILKDCGHRRSIVNLDITGSSKAFKMLKQAIKQIENDYRSKTVRITVTKRIDCLRMDDNGDVAIIAITVN